MHQACNSLIALESVLEKKPQPKCPQKHFASLSSLYTRMGQTLPFPPPIRTDFIWVHLPALAPCLMAQRKDGLPPAAKDLLMAEAPSSCVIQLWAPLALLRALRGSEMLTPARFSNIFFQACFPKPSIIHWCPLQSPAEHVPSSSTQELCLSFISLYHYGDVINMQKSSRHWLEMLLHVLPTGHYPLIIHMPEEWLPMFVQLLCRVPASLSSPLHFPSHIHTLPLHAKPVFYSLCSCCSSSW